MKEPGTSNGRTLAAAMIVKDEEAVLDRCLASIRDVVDEIVVVDTGSTDRTKEIALSYGARIYDLEWENDFSKARNFGLEKISSDWILHIDADEELTSDDHAQLRRIVESSDSDVVSIMIMDVVAAEMRYYPRLFRNYPEFRYKNPVHEGIDFPRAKEDLKYRFARIKLIHHGYTSDIVQDKNKLQRNEEIVAQALKEDPDSASLHFHVARHHMAKGEYEAAEASFLKVISIAEYSHFLALAYRKYIDLLTLQDRYEEIIDIGKEAIRKIPEYTDMYFLVGINYLRVGRPRRALTYFEECLKRGESPPVYESIPGAGDVLALLFYGYCLQQSNEKRKAEDAFAKAISELRNNPMALAYLSKILITNEGRGAALEKIKSLADLKDPAVSQILKIQFPEIA